ncbi:lysoplasmalogenase [Rhodococcus artemisiae]|uniref:Lysoplasmalogenase n=1 Tax=Rhodococcus artemisiae TaxID=714159 RepID=A0ABU7L3G9_9NOCA|nr:lysoplasmalogenase [Rhodococcus artemisiae]MEE2056101.1 lysoplasmalogenase [Rhodococcus artemisiae]
MTQGIGARIAFAGFGVLAAVHLIAQLIDPETMLVDATQWLLMPVLATALVLGTTAPRSRLVELTLVALTFSWLGDTAPDLFDGDTSFLVLVGFFLCAQVTYIAAFLPYRAGSVLHTRRWVLVVFGVAVVALVAVCAPGAGVLLIPVVVYALCLATMAILATGVGRAVAIGAVIFVVSDSLIALRAFVSDFPLPLSGFWVMLTYIAAQVLITHGVMTRDRAARDEDADRSAASTLE